MSAFYKWLGSSLLGGRMWYNSKKILGLLFFLFNYSAVHWTVEYDMSGKITTRHKDLKYQHRFVRKKYHTVMKYDCIAT